MVPSCSDTVDQVAASDVGSHDDDGVLEVHRPALIIGQTAVIQQLQQDIEHIRMGFFDLVKQDYAVRLPSYGFGQLAALVVAHVSRRRSYQSGDGVLLHVLGHIDTDHVLLVVEQRFGQSLGQLGLADAGRSEEDEGTDRPVFILEPGPCSEHGFSHGLDAFFLADDSFMQYLRQLQQLFPFAFHQLADRDTGPAGDDFRDFFFA